MNSLFRKEAIEHKHQRLYGEVLILPRLSHTSWVVLLSAWVFFVILWLSYSSYARKETVNGWLEPPEGIIKVYAEGNGVITNVMVKEGDFVEQNQPLVIINGDRLLTDGKQLENSLLKEYQHQEKLLQEQLVRNRSIYTKKNVDIDQRIEAAKQDLDLIGSQIITMQQRINLLSSQLKNLETLEKKGHASEIEKSKAKQEQLGLTSELQSLSRNQIHQKNQLNQLKNEKLLLPEEQANDRDSLRTELSQVVREISKIKARRAYVVKASKAGTVNNLRAKQGLRPKTSIPILSIVPQNTQLSAQLLVPVRAAGFVQEGQLVDIRYDAFPYQKFGMARGAITKVSDAILLPSELIDYPVTSPEPAYVVYAKLDLPTMRAYDKNILLKSGMTLSADIELENRSVFQWLLEPIYSLKGRL